MEAKERGIAWYDLGGIDEKANPHGFEFKTRAGGMELAALGPFEARPRGARGAAAGGLISVAETLYRRIRA